MVKCDRCSGRGHTAAQCASPPISAPGPPPPALGGRRATAEEPDTDEESGGSTASADEEEATASEVSSVASCGMCTADRNRKCKMDTCDAAADRLERIETRKRAQKPTKKVKKSTLVLPAAAGGSGATRAATAAGAAAAAGVPASIGPSADEILKLTRISDLAALTPVQTVEVPEVFYAVLLAKHKDMRLRYHQKYFDAIEAKSQLNVPPSGQVSQGDLRRATDLMELVKILTEPTEDGSITVELLKKRIAHVASLAVREVLATRDAREEGWTIVRDALAIHRAEVGQPKAWREAMIKSRAKQKSRPAGAGASSPASPGRHGPKSDGKKRFRSKKGGGRGGKDGKG